MMDVPTHSLLAPPDDPAAHINALQRSFLAGDVIAPFQVAAYVQEENIGMPTWAIQPFEDTLVGVLLQKRGTKGKGNSAFGKLRKGFIRTVRASAYLYVRAWQKDPHRYGDLPIQTYEHWHREPLLWQSYRKASDAARLAGTSLRSTEFVANATTLRRAAYCFPEPVLWGRREAETKLGLRGEAGIFGPMPDRLAPHIQSLLSKRTPKY